MNRKNMEIKLENYRFTWLPVLDNKYQRINKNSAINEDKMTSFHFQK